ncbi:MAG: hypothetical protein VX370_01650, partial [Bacteroidota bacterium]|nr:hypothetical protein [Bacteroidota bacterium]
MKKLLLILLCLPMIGFGQGCTLDDIFIFDFSESRFKCKLKALDKKNYVKHNPDILEPWYFNEWFDYPYLPPNSVYKTSDFYFHILQLKEFNCMHNWNKIKHYTTNYASNRLHGYNNMRLVFANDK